MDDYRAEDSPAERTAELERALADMLDTDERLAEYAEAVDDLRKQLRGAVCPGYEPPPADAPADTVGTWTFRVPGGPAFAVNAALVLRMAAEEATNEARRGVFTRLADAVEGSLPE